MSNLLQEHWNLYPMSWSNADLYVRIIIFAWTLDSVYLAGPWYIWHLDKEQEDDLCHHHFTLCLFSFILTHIITMSSVLLFGFKMFWPTVMGIDSNTTLVMILFVGNQRLIKRVKILARVFIDGTNFVTVFLLNKKR